LPIEFIINSVYRRGVKGECNYDKGRSCFE